MKPLLITALSSLLPAGTIPTEIVYLPEGENTITATVDGKPQTVVVKVPPDKGAQIASALQASLDRRAASNVRPWFDFEHKRGAASALPKAFRYEPGKGVMCSLDWTAAGRSAIEGRDYSYFSPEFYLDENGIPAGLPERGPLGALVNEPAFRSIPRIAAGDSSQTGCNQDGGGDTFYRDLARDRGLGEHPDEDAAKMALVEAFPALYSKFLEQEKAKRHAEAVSAGDSATVRQSIEGRAEALVAAGSARNIDEALGMVMASDPKSYERYGAVLAIEREDAAKAELVTAAAAIVRDVRQAARQLVAGGSAADETEGVERVFAADAALYDRYLAAGCPDIWA